MSIELPVAAEEQLQNLASKLGRDVPTLVQKALRQCIEPAAITDIEADEVAEIQLALLGELPPASDWRAPGR